MAIGGVAIGGVGWSNNRPSAVHARSAVNLESSTRTLQPAGMTNTAVRSLDRHDQSALIARIITDIRGRETTSMGLAVPNVV